MTTFVVDASVAVKWVLPHAKGEHDIDRALALLAGIRRGALDVVQPIHWLLEVAAVVARLAPDQVATAVGLLAAMEFPIAGEVEVLERACALATKLDHHLFDTLYHAVALATPDATLVTADDRYHRKAHRIGRIVRLSELQETAR